MKKLLIIMTLIASTFISGSAQNSDLQQIETILNNYLDGLIDGDAKLLTTSFHPSATMKVISDEGYKEYNAIAALTADLSPSSRKTTSTNIVSITMAGNAASAQLEIHFPTFTYVDFMNILKVEGEWKIVNKIYYTRYE